MLFINQTVKKQLKIKEMEKNYPLKLTTRKGGKNSTTKKCKPKARKNHFVY